MNKDRQLKFKGDHFEVGKQMGEIYKALGKKEMIIPKHADDYFKTQLTLYEKFYPNYITYLEGTASGLKINKDIILKSYLTEFLSIAHKKENNKCSTFIVNNSKGVFVGRNYDWFESSEENSKLIRCEFNDSYKITYISDMGTWKFGKKANPASFLFIADDAWNDYGLYIGLSGAPGKERSIGISTPQLVQLIAENCKTINEAIKLLEQIPIPDPKIFTLADSQGNLAIVEKRAGNETRVLKSKDIIYTSNHYNHPDFVKYNEEIFKIVPFHSTWSRYNYLKFFTQKDFNNIDINKIIEIMSIPPVIQNWRGIENGDSITVWTLALNLKNLNYKLIFEPLKNKITYEFN